MKRIVISISIEDKTGEYKEIREIFEVENISVRNGDIGTLIDNVKEDLFSIDILRGE